MVQRGKVDSVLLQDVENDPYGFDGFDDEQLLLIDEQPAWLTLQDVIEETLAQRRR